MSDVPQAHIERWMEHIRALAEQIGPRASASPAERRAADYAMMAQFKLGLQPTLEGFRGARSLFLVHVYVGICVLLAFLVYPLAGRLTALAALLLAGLGLVSEIMELLFRDHPLRYLLPYGRSQNVVTLLRPVHEHRRDLVLMGHLDTNHTPLVFRSTAWVNVWRVASSIIFFSFVIQVPVYAVGLITQATIIWPLSIPGAVCALLLIIVCAEAELSPFSHGANDNATAAGLVLTLAEDLQAEPLAHTRVWLVCSGCEEVKHYGAIDFYRRHRDDLRNPAVVVFEMLGRDGPAWLCKEGTINLFNYHADPGMAALARQVAEAHPELGAHPTQVSGGHTEMADALRLGIPAITLIGLDEGGVRFGYDGPEIYWHTREDTVDKIIPEVLAKNYAFARQFVHAFDRQAAEGGV
jgi:hypothetical protein